MNVPESEGAHLARLEERVEGIRSDLGEINAELARTRKRLHDVEGVTQAFMDMQNVNRQKEARQYRRLGVQIQVLTIVVALAAIVAPIVTAIALRH